MLDFEVQRCTRRCAAEGRELEPGETFYSVLLSEGADVVRYDYSERSWQGPPPGALGVWKSCMPSADASKVHWAPNDVMLHYFEHLEEDAERQDVRYVLALLMVRRRILRLEELDEGEGPAQKLSLFCPRNEKQYEVTVREPSPERIEQIQEELAQMLFARAA